MNKGQIAAEIRQASSLNEIWDVFNKYYDLDQQLGAISGSIAKAQITAQFENVINKLKIQPRQNGNTAKRKKLFS